MIWSRISGGSCGSDIVVLAHTATHGTMTVIELVKFRVGASSLSFHLRFVDWGVFGIYSGYLSLHHSRGNTIIRGTNSNDNAMMSFTKSLISTTRELPAVDTR